MSRPDDRAIWAVLDLAVNTAVAAAVVLILLLLVACGGRRPLGIADGGPEWRPSVSGLAGEQPTQREKARTNLHNTAIAVGWVAGLAALAALGTLIASFIVPVIPRGLSAACLAGALAAWALQYAIVVYGEYFAEAATWLALAVGVFVAWTVGWPWAVALRNRSLNRLGKSLEREHPDAAVALQAVATAMPPARRRAKLRSLTAPDHQDPSP